jgi:hypothetical protein
MLSVWHEIDEELEGHRKVVQEVDGAHPGSGKQYTRSQSQRIARETEPWEGGSPVRVLVQ